MQYDGIGWLAEGINYEKDSVGLYIDGKFYEINQGDLDRAFCKIVEDRISGDLHNQHFQEVIGDTIVGWDWVLRYVLADKGLNVIAA